MQRVLQNCCEYCYIILIKLLEGDRSFVCVLGGGGGGDMSARAKTSPFRCTNLFFPFAAILGNSYL